MNKKKFFQRIVQFSCFLVLTFSLLTGCIPSADKVAPKKFVPYTQSQIDSTAFNYNFLSLVNQRYAIYQKVQFPVKLSNYQKISEELQKKVLSGELKPDQIQNEYAKIVNNQLVDYTNKKQKYLQDINKKALLLQGDIGKLPKKDQPVAKQALNDFITAASDEIKMYQQLPELFKSSIDIGKKTSKANEISSTISKIFCITPAYAEGKSDTCQCSVTTEYLSPQLKKITTTCICKIYIEYKKRINKVIKDQQKFVKSLSQFIEHIKQNVKPAEISKGRYQTKDGSIIQGKVIKQVNNVPKIRPASEKMDLNTVARVRKELGIPAIGNDYVLKELQYLKAEQTVAVLKSDGVQIWGRNGWGSDQGGYKAMRTAWLKSGGQRSMSATNNQTVFHAEGDAFWNLYQYRKQHNILGGTATLVVDRPFCTACGDSRGVQQLVEEVGLDKLVVITPAGKETITPRPGKRRVSW
ncbi:hypothetical protein [Shimazuella kribbensis]|uniref:hypothetical protein n=1 Tax=Shimazuella kribbensis TaxID=139808 RepID=UPI00040E3362|nr:hypothetical protein [Shimazuella kribbensis]